MGLKIAKKDSGIIGEASLRECIIAPRKMRMVADIIRNKKVIDALRILDCEQKKCSTYFKKLLLSASANYEKNCEKDKNVIFNINDLFITELQVDAAGMLKRVLPAPQGRAFRIRRRNSHVFVVVKKIGKDIPATEIKRKKKSTGKKKIINKKVKIEKNIKDGE